MRKTFPAVITVLLVSSVLQFHGQARAQQTRQLPRVEQQAPQIQQTITARIVKVIDPGTILVHYKDRNAEFRLIGVDHGGGRKYTAAVATLAKEGDAVNIEFDTQKRLSASRFLGYLYLTNGTMLNQEIIRLGYAKIQLVPPNFRYREKLSEAHREARAAKRGVWGGSTR